MEGAHPSILEKISRINFEKNPGYGDDPYSAAAADKIRAACGCPDADVTFLVGGTQTNDTIIDALLQSYQGVISPETGHINCHEAGAIEHSGHKVLGIGHRQGKISAEELENYLSVFYSDANHDHMIQPGMVYISHPTEYGTLYKKSELEQIHSICKKYGIALFLDGARLGYGLMAEGTDVTLRDIARLTDVFYIGGTKVGALFGEAVVFTGISMPRHMLTIKKQHGGLLAKGFLLGAQFDVLFTDDLYFKISENAIKCAMQLKKLFISKGYRLFIDSSTNQQFIIMPDAKLKELEGKVTYSFWEKYDAHNTVVRFATSWATTPEYVQSLEQYL
jgi:threonine aldolase